MKTPTCLYCGRKLRKKTSSADVKPGVTPEFCPYTKQKILEVTRRRKRSYYDPPRETVFYWTGDWGGYGDGYFCGQTCGYRFAVHVQDELAKRRALMGAL